MVRFPRASPEMRSSPWPSWQCRQAQHNRASIDARGSPQRSGHERRHGVSRTVSTGSTSRAHRRTA